MPEAGGDRIAEPSIEASGLAIGYPGADGGTVVLSDVDLRVERGDFLTILGPSGCGKSTLLRVVADLLPPLAGAIAVLGHPPARARSRREVALRVPGSDPAALAHGPRECRAAAAGRARAA